MQDLTLVGVHEDGEHVLLVATDGQRYRLRVDEALRAAVRRDRPRLGQLQIEMDGKLRPRDIQARIRAGQSAAQVAEAASLPLEHVRRFEGPVLAEREHVATLAQKVVLRRTGASGLGIGPATAAPTLGELVAERLERREVPAESVGWDAWRADEGHWTVQLTFTAGSRQRHAQWTYDPRVRHVAALDDEARWLTEPEAEPDLSVPQRRLASVRDVAAADAAAAGAGDAIDLTDGAMATQDDAEPADEPPARPTTVDLLDTLRARRGRRGRPMAPSEDDAGDPLEDLLGSLLAGSTAGGDGDPARPEPLNDPGPNHPARRAGQASGMQPGHPSGQAAPGRALADLPDDAPAVAEAGVAQSGQSERPAAARGKSRRASVPSWDDIVFGARRE